MRRYQEVVMSLLSLPFLLCAAVFALLCLGLTVGVLSVFSGLMLKYMVEHLPFVPKLVVQLFSNPWNLAGLAVTIGFFAAASLLSYESPDNVVRGRRLGAKREAKPFQTLGFSSRTQPGKRR